MIRGDEVVAVRGGRGGESEVSEVVAWASWGEREGSSSSDSEALEIRRI